MKGPRRIFRLSRACRAAVIATLSETSESSSGLLALDIASTPGICFRSKAERFAVYRLARAIDFDDVALVESHRTCLRCGVFVDERRCPRCKQTRHLALCPGAPRCRRCVLGERHVALGYTADGPQEVEVQP